MIAAFPRGGPIEAHREGTWNQPKPTSDCGLAPLHAKRIGRHGHGAAARLFPPGEVDNPGTSSVRCARHAAEDFASGWRIYAICSGKARITAAVRFDTSNLRYMFSRCVRTVPSDSPS